MFGEKHFSKNKNRKSQSKFIPFLSWKDDKSVKNLFFLTPVDKVSTILLHNFIKKTITGDDGKKKDIWMTFMCRKDPSWQAESGNECPICDDLGLEPQERAIALAVEVNPVYDDKGRAVDVEVVTKTATNRDGDDVEYPQWGLVAQSGLNFFNVLSAMGQRRDISDISWEITREGKDQHTKYVFFPLDASPNLSPFSQYIPDLNDLLEDLGSIERYERDLEGVKAEDQRKWPKASSNGHQEDENLPEMFKTLKKDLSKKEKASSKGLEEY